MPKACAECDHPPIDHDNWGCATPVIRNDARVWCDCTKRRVDFTPNDVRRTSAGEDDQ